jgi:hypothetical protein
MRHRHAHVAMVVRPDRAGRSWALEGAALFIDYLFANWDFRKLYAEVVDFNLTQFASITDLPAFAVEGRLTEHEYYGERLLGRRGRRTAARGLAGVHGGDPGPPGGSPGTGRRLLAAAEG